MRRCLPVSVAVLCASSAMFPSAGLGAQPARTPPAAWAAVRDTGAAPRAPAAVAGGLTGQIVDAATGEVLADALVVLVLRPEGVMASAGAGAGAFPAAARQAQSDAAGRYQFDALAPGAYRIRASRLGYAPATADVTVADATPEVSLGLAVAPLALRPIEVRGTPPTAPPRRLAGPRPGAADLEAAGRLGAIAERQRVYLTTDAREVTRADVSEAATLAESDLFRALQRLPGVSTRDEWSAELWTRGARPDLTRVTLDGMPLFSPTAALGLLSAVNSDAVGSATLLPGVRPASLGEGGAAVLDLRTRAGGRSGGRTGSGVGGVAELGVMSARLTLDGGSAGGRAGWAVSGRRSYIDAVGHLVDRSTRFPDFGDLTARGDLRLSPTQTLAASGLLQHTAAPYNSLGLRSGDQGAVWGNRVLRLTHAALVGGLRVTHTAGTSAYGFGGRGPFQTFEPYTPVTAAESVAVATIVPGTHVGQPRIRASTLLLRGELAPAPHAAPGGAEGAAPAWGLGYELARQHASYAGAGRRFFFGTGFHPYPVESSTHYDSLARADSMTARGALTVGTLWATRRWRPTAGLEVEPGLRLELAGGGDVPAAFRPAPRLAARYTLDADARLSAALGRSVQYTQALPPNGIDNEARFYPGALWLIAARGVPALTTDQATVGAERWFGGGWLGSVNAYARRTAGFATHDPVPGLTADRALYVIGRERGRGIELSARRLVGRTTASFAYSWSRSTLDAGGFQYASPQDRTHVFDVTLSRRLGARWRVGGALSAATGTPYTRTVERYFLPDSVPGDPYIGTNALADGGQVRDVPNARRNPAFYNASLVAEWTRPVGAWHLGAFAQLQSPLATFTSDAYRGAEYCYAAPGTPPAAVTAPGARCTVYPRNLRQGTLPVIPTVGLRLAF